MYVHKLICTQLASRKRVLNLHGGPTSRARDVNSHRGPMIIRMTGPRWGPTLRLDSPDKLPPAPTQTKPGPRLAAPSAIRYESEGLGTSGEAKPQWRTLRPIPTRRRARPSPKLPLQSD